MSSSSQPQVILRSSFDDHEEEVDVVAFGDSDDHLRLSVLIADVTERRFSSAAPADAVAACKTKSTSWSDRENALTEILETWDCGEERLLVGNPDGLHQGKVQSGELWDDVNFRRERNNLFWLLADFSVECSNIGFVRVQNRRDVTADFVKLGLQREDRTEPESQAGTARLSPEIRKVGKWLIERGTLTGTELERQIEWFGEAADTNEAEQTVVSVAHDCLPPSARRAAELLSNLRYEQPVNGAIGPFQSSTPTSKDLPAISTEARELLLDCGFLQAAGGNRVRMPTLVRQFLQKVATSDPENDRIHRAIADEKAASSDIRDQLEVHHHAVEGLDLSRALHEAEYYAADVREIGYRLSIEGKYAEAADVYRELTKLDSQDAYAWEYYAYNLARAETGDEKHIERAFEKAHELADFNPLYHGRLLGFRAERGADVTPDFCRALKHYENVPDAVAYFALPVLKGLERGGHTAQLDQLISNWRTRLRQAQDPKIDEFISGRGHGTGEST